MTLKEMKIKTFSLIEEYYPELNGLAEDEDVLNKINGVVNQIQTDLMTYRKLNAFKEINIAKEDSKTLNLKELIPDCYQLNKIVFSDTVEYEMPNAEILILPNDYVGSFTIYYYKYPKMAKIDFENEEESKLFDESFEFDLDNSLLEIMPYGIAADLLKMDMISNYGSYFYNRYLEMKNKIDPRRTSGIIEFVGGVDV